MLIEALWDQVSTAVTSLKAWWEMGGGRKGLRKEQISFYPLE